MTKEPSSIARLNINHMGFCGSCAARQNEAGGRVGLAVLFVPGPHTSQSSSSTTTREVVARCLSPTEMDGDRASSSVRRGVLRVRCEV